MDGGGVKKLGGEKKKEKANMPKSAANWFHTRWELEMILEKTISSGVPEENIQEVIEILQKTQAQLVCIQGQGEGVEEKELLLTKPKSAMEKPGEETKEALGTPQVMKAKQPQRLVTKPDVMSRKRFRRSAQKCDPPREKPGEETHPAPDTKASDGVICLDETMTQSKG